MWRLKGENSRQSTSGLQSQKWKIYPDLHLKCSHILDRNGLLNAMVAPIFPDCAQCLRHVVIESEIHGYKHNLYSKGSTTTYVYTFFDLDEKQASYA